MATIVRRLSLIGLPLVLGAATITAIAVPAASAGVAVTVTTTAPASARVVTWTPAGLVPVHTYELSFTVASSAVRDRISVVVVSTAANGVVLSSTSSSVPTFSAPREDLIDYTIPDGAARTTVTFRSGYGALTVADRFVTEIAMVA